MRSGLVPGASESLVAARLSTGRLFLPFQAGASGRAFMAEATNWSLKSHCVPSSTGSDGSVRLKTLLFRWAVRALDLWSLLPGSAKRLAASQVSLPAGPPDAAAALRPCLRDGHGAPACLPRARDSHPTTPEKQPAPFFITVVPRCYVKLSHARSGRKMVMSTSPGRNKLVLLYNADSGGHAHTLGLF